jgi:hypothetical protein
MLGFALAILFPRLSYSALSPLNPWFPTGGAGEVLILILFVANWFIASFITGKLGYTEYRRKIRMENQS